MFTSASLKLTVWYLAFIMAISLFFSWSIYVASTREVRAGFAQQSISYHGVVLRQAVPDPEVEDWRLQQVELIKQRIWFNLLVLNVGVFVLGGCMSYLLARNTLKPIEQAMEAQSRFTADASHELRTPLTAMKTEIEVAMRHNKLPASEARELLKSNLEEIGKLEALSSGLLRLSQYQNGPRQEAWRSVDMAAVVLEAVNRLEAPAGVAGVHLDASAVGPAGVEGEPDSLRELVVILLDNAIKYSHPNTDIVLSLAARSGQAVLVVSDHGVGMKAADLPHIFDRFYRADASRSRGKSGGYGLGLAIARQIVTTHHGEIGVTSLLGEGSVFTVSIPEKQSQGPGILS